MIPSATAAATATATCGRSGPGWKTATRQAYSEYFQHNKSNKYIGPDSTSFVVESNERAVKVVGGEEDRRREMHADTMQAD